MLRQAARYGEPVIVVLIVAIQFVHPERTNPPPHAEARLTSADVEKIWSAAAPP
jgi:hypothetical protein